MTKNGILFSFFKEGIFPLSLFAFKSRKPRFEAFDIDTDRSNELVLINGKEIDIWWSDTYVRRKMPLDLVAAYMKFYY